MPTNGKMNGGTTSVCQNANVTLKMRLQTALAIKNVKSVGTT